jgi:GxxExxY protein
VLNTLGVGFLEKVYENALAQALRNAALAVDQQHRVKVHYHGVVAGGYSTGLLVADMLLVEMKTVRALDDVHRMQCTNYLQTAGLPPGLLLNLAARAIAQFPQVTPGNQPRGRGPIKSHETICVFRVHLLSSASKFFLVPRRRSTGRRGQYPESLTLQGPGSTKRAGRVANPPQYHRRIDDAWH